MIQPEWPAEPAEQGSTGGGQSLAVEVIGAELVEGLQIDSIEDLIASVLVTERIDQAATVNVVLVGDERMRQLHWQFLHDASDTDVMTFPFENDSGSESAWGGEIVIAVGQADRQAHDHDNTIVDEVHFLVIHGLLHLCGWDDLQDGDRAAMIQRQDELFGAWVDRRHASA